MTTRQRPTVVNELSDRERALDYALRARETGVWSKETDAKAIVVDATEFLEFLRGDEA